MSDTAEGRIILFFPRGPRFAHLKTRQSRHMPIFDGESKFNAQISSLLTREGALSRSKRRTL
jgi:hypothetical protein